MQGQIIKILSNDYFVSKDNVTYVCKSRGQFRKDNITPLVGDYVIFDIDQKYILDVLPRKNSLIRPNVANIDQALVMTSLKKPDLDLVLLDRLLVTLKYSRVDAIICFSKKDLLSHSELKEVKKIVKYYSSIGYTVIFNNKLRKIKKLLKNKTTVFTGQTGSGKSSLINKLNPSLSFDTGEISEALGRGKHTTRHTELVEMYHGKVLDTPGFSDVDLSKIDNLKDYFVEFKKYPCPYKDCEHINEKDCEIKRQVELGNILLSRYQNYKKLKESR